ncbi:hypothetical protein XH88_10750 [Bradyrhizobium sp. CCBAU 51627]|nr:hypothetical protein [Bradyrhizobium sp. CCBAU 51627]
MREQEAGAATATPWLTALEHKDAKTKALLADAMHTDHANGCGCKKLVTSAARREAVAHLRNSLW